MSSPIVLILPPDWEARYGAWKEDQKKEDRILRTVRVPVVADEQLCVTAQEFGLTADAFASMCLTLAVTPPDEAYLAFFMALDTMKGDGQKAIKLYTKLMPAVGSGLRLKVAS